MTTATGAGGSVPERLRSVPGLAAPVRRPRRRVETGSLAGATLSAAFLGLLLGPAAAAVGQPESTGSGEGGDGHDGVAAGSPSGRSGAVQGGEASLPAAPRADGGAQADADLAGLTAVAGDVAPFVDEGDAGSELVAPDVLQPGAAPAAPVLQAGLPLGEMALALPADGNPVLPPVPHEGEDIGDIGEHQAGTDGDDTLIGTDRDDHIDGRDGDDLIYGGAGNDSLLGGNGEDTVYGDSGDDEIDGGNGNDLLFGGTGNDLIEGGAGNDRAYGGTGLDTLYGGADNDRLDGGTGADIVDGGTGRDVLVVDELHDLALEHTWGSDGGGIDTLEVTAAFTDSLREALPDLASNGLATFVLGTETGAALPDGAVGWTQQVHPNIENLRLLGEAAHDAIGDERANRLTGNAGDNRLYGEAGDDLLEGGAGDDWLEGGDGSDLMYGDAGDDVFMLGLNDSGVDTIFDHSGSNRLVLDGGDAAQLTATLVGDELHLAHAGRALAVLDGYAGHEAEFTGIEIGGQLHALDQLVGRTPDMLADYLPRPDMSGTADDDILQATGPEGAWLAGRAGSDTLLGSDGDDRLEGGQGNDVLRGGNGDDTYVVGDANGGLDRITDASGRSTIEISGAQSEQIGAFLVGRDLWLTVDEVPVAVLERHELRPEALAGVRAGDRMIDPHELMA